MLLKCFFSIPSLRFPNSLYGPPLPRNHKIRKPAGREKHMKFHTKTACVCSWFKNLRAQTRHFKTSARAPQHNPHTQANKVQRADAFFVQRQCNTPHANSSRGLTLRKEPDSTRKPAHNKKIVDAFPALAHPASPGCRDMNASPKKRDALPCLPPTCNAMPAARATAKG